MLDAETQCFRVKMSLQALLSKVCILMTSQKKTRREKRVCKKRKQFVIGSRIRERDKNNAEYYVGDYSVVPCGVGLMTLSRNLRSKFKEFFADLFFYLTFNFEAIRAITFCFELDP